MRRTWPAAGSGPSLYEFVRDHLGDDGKLTEDGVTLPDEPQAGDGEIRWAPGAMDGAFGHHGGGGGAEERAATVAASIAAASAKPSRRNLRAMYEAVSSDDVLDVIDPMIEALVARAPHRGSVHELGRWLATKGADRGAVKVGLALLGITGLGDDVGVVRTLGAHDEFTLFASVAMANGLEDPDRELWALARSLDGWGRIQCVERLAATADPEIQRWILREGFRNSVMYEYLAYTAATAGGLLAALRSDAVDRDLLTAAGEILEALVAGGPAQDLDDWAEGADAVEAYLDLMGTRAETLGDFRAVAAIRSYLSDDDGWDERSLRGWTATRRGAFEARCDEIMGRPQWADAVAVGLLSDEPGEFWVANDVARRIGMDTFDVLVARIEADPYQGPWFDAWNLADGDRATTLVDLARRLLPIRDVAAGPATSLGIGPGSELFMAVEWTLQALRHHEGVGGDLLLIGLRSPVIRNRNMSLRALKAWNRSAWPAEAEADVTTVATSDPDDRVREFAQEVLAAATG